MSPEAALNSQKAELLVLIQTQRRDLEFGGDRNADQLDQVSAEASREDAGRNIQRSRDMLREIEATLLRVDEGEYGLCIDCGEEISAKRLAARLTALRCIGCQDIYERTPVN